MCSYVTSALRHAVAEKRSEKKHGEDERTNLHTLCVLGGGRGGSCERLSQKASKNDRKLNLKLKVEISLFSWQT